MSNTRPYSYLPELTRPRSASGPISSVVPVPRGPKKALVVDDDAALARANARVLRRAGFTVSIAANGLEALQRAQNEDWDAILTDITMPEMDGIELLRTLRESGNDVPVLLLTAVPGLESAKNAVLYGAHQYLTKPLATDDLVAAVHRAACIYQMNRDRKLLPLNPFPDEVVTKRFSLNPALEIIFEEALRKLYVVYQPIVAPNREVIVAYEALVRSHESTMARPAQLLDAAERLGRMHDIGRTVRSRVADTLATMTGDVFVNVHAEDLLDDQLYSSDSPLSQHARRVTLEITERASLETVPDVRARVLRLRELGYHVAIDDLGAGYAGLSSFVVLEPDVVKIDMSLIRNVDREPLKQKLVSSMLRVGQDLGLLVIAEGVETAAERSTLTAMGCEYHQGFLYAHAAETFPEVTW